MEIFGGRSSSAQSFCQTCVHFDFAHLAVNMIRRFVIQGYTTLMVVCGQLFHLVFAMKAHSHVGLLTGKNKAFNPPTQCCTTQGIYTTVSLTLSPIVGHVLGR